MRRVIVGTAGHIDHGKTRLVEAITGIDCDRWEEERRRGITIDLGFAHLERDDVQIGFIDVPGHERFVHNALAGLGGIRIMLLVVAADEGVEPQTLEHLEICALLGIPRALVVLTKSDLVSPDLLELARLEVEELLASSRWPDAEILAASAVDGTGVEEVVERLVALTASLPAEDLTSEPVRLPIDRAFQLRGLGSIVTGTLVSGSVEVGRELEVLPGGERAKVRSIQVHGAELSRALAGERTALQLGGISLAELERGQQLAEPATLAASSSLLVRFETLPGAPAPLAGWTDIQAHVYSSEVVGRLRPLDTDELAPGETCIAEVRLAAPVVTVRGDRFVARRLSPPTTLGGGKVLDPSWRRPRGVRQRRAVEALGTSTEKAVGFWVDDARLRGLEATQVARRLGTRATDAATLLEELEERLGLLRLAPGQGGPVRWMASRHFEKLESEARRLLERYLERQRLAAGMPRAEAVERLLPGLPAELTRIYLDWLERRGVVVQDRDLLNLPGRTASLSGEESDLATRLRAVYSDAALQPPAPSAVAEELGAKPQIVDGVLHYLVQQGELIKLSGGLIISADALAAARRELLQSGLDEFTVAQFRDHFGLSRKWAIPILEHFDAARVTHRLGDIRRIVPPMTP